MDQRILKELNAFAIKHKVILEEKGEVGFGRPCVGFLRGSSFIDYNASIDYPNPLFPGDEEIWSTVDDAYHKHNCLAVLVNDDDYEEALTQLHKWITDWDKEGIEIVEFDPKPTSLVQALMTGATGYAIRLKKDIEKDISSDRER